MIPNVEVAMVLFMGWRVCDVVVKEGRKGPAPGGCGLRRLNEAVCWLGWWLVGGLRLINVILNWVRPPRPSRRIGCPAHTTIRKACGLDKVSGLPRRVSGQ